MKFQRAAEQRKRKKKIPLGEMGKHIVGELGRNPGLRERWAAVMNMVRMDPKRRHKGPDIQRIATKPNTASIGGAVRNKYGLPVDEWGPEYGTWRPQKLLLKSFADGVLVPNVVFHSRNNRYVPIIMGNSTIQPLVTSIGKTHPPSF